MTKRTSYKFWIAGIAFMLLSSLSSCECGTDPDDTTPPAKISNFQVDSIDQGTVWLSWIATGDDDNSGTASEYHLRFAPEYTALLNDWNNTTAATGLPAPQSQGNEESFELIDISADTTFYFAIKAADENNNMSAISDFDSVRWHSPISLTLPDIQVADCSKIAVPITAINLTVITGVEIHVQYDTGQAVYDSVTSDYLNGMMSDTTAGIVSILWASLADITDLFTVPNGEPVAVIHFSNLTDTSQLTFNAETEIVDYAGDPIILELNNGSMECTGK